MKPPVWVIGLSVAVFIFMMSPVLLVLYISFMESAYVSFPPSGYSLDWYTQIMQRSQLFDGMVYSFAIAACATLLSVGFGAIGAIGVSRGKLPGKTVLANGFTLPLVIPTIVTGVAIYIFLYRTSTLMGERLVPSTGALILAHTLITLPWTFRLCYAGLQSIGPHVERASLDLGQTPTATMFRVTLPMLRPSLIGAAIFAFIFSFGDLEISLFLVSPGQITLPVAMVQYAQFRVDPSLAAISSVQIALVGVLLLIANRFVKLGETFSGGVKQ